MILTFRLTITLHVLSLLLLGFLPPAEAVSPPPDGGYANANTAEGTDALFNLATGANNTALGFNALFSNTTGDYNTATGSRALLANFSGGANTANGYNALSANTTGIANTAVGKDALLANTGGSVNTAIGDVALTDNTSGSANTASGVNALAANTTGFSNTADGVAALMTNTTGAYNTASGSNALLNTISGSNNIALGYQAGANLMIGDSNIYIGASGAPRESGQIRIGTRGAQSATYIAGISGATVSGGAAVYVDSKGHLGTVTSSARYKEEIRPMAGASDVIWALKPVTFRYKKEFDPQGLTQFGLVAEEVAQVAPELVVRDETGEPYTVRYEAVNAMLLNELLKEHANVEALAAKVARQEEMLREVLDRLDRTRQPDSSGTNQPTDDKQ